MPSNTLSIGTAGGSKLITKSLVVTAENSQSYEFTVADGVTDQLVAMSIDVSQLKAIYMVSDQNIQLETNAVDATGGNTLNLIANEPYIWWATALHANLLTLDVTASYWTNSSGATATVNIELVVDPTV